MRSRLASWVFGVVAVGILGGCALSAQTGPGTIKGTVTDQAGTAIRKATITVTRDTTGFERTVATNKAGEYSISSLRPGSYNLKALANGYFRLIKEDVAVEGGAPTRRDFKLWVEHDFGPITFDADSGAGATAVVSYSAGRAARAADSTVPAAAVPLGNDGNALVYESSGRIHWATVGP